MSGEQQPRQRSLTERLLGRPRVWVVWAYAALALVWVVLAFTEPSGFHTFLAIAWTLLAAAQTAGYLIARRSRRTEAAAEEPQGR
ncbi:hypothetical protein ACWGJ9_09175 [Curtobacterium citreum]